MEESKKLIIACGSMQNEIEYFAAQSDNYRTVFMEPDLHRHPERIRSRVQAVLNENGDRFSDVIVGYGLCSNALVGLQVPVARLVVPMVHDCISLYLGSRDTYFEMNRKKPRTYFLTAGWLYQYKDPLGIVEKEYAPRLGMEESMDYMKSVLRHYTEFALITNTIQQDTNWLHERLSRNAEVFEKKQCEIEGSLTYFEQMVFGPWCEPDFLIFEKAETINQMSFYNGRKKK